jgi:hypothetical protein
MSRMPRFLVIAGLLIMLLGAVDPLEGSLLILPGSGLLAVGAYLGKTTHRKPLLWSFALVLVGVSAMFLLSAYGGIGGNTGRSYWVGLVILPYPVGWLAGLYFGIRTWRETPRK